MNINLVEIVHALKDEAELTQPLCKLLKLDAVERNEALKKLAFTMKNHGAPQNLVDTILALQRSDLAQQVLRSLED